MLLFIGIILPLFSFSIEGSLLIQMIALSIFLLSAALAQLQNPQGRHTFGMDNTTLIICFLIPIISLLAISLAGRIDLVPQTLAFMACAIAARMLVTVYGIEKICKVFIYANCSIAIIVFFLEFNSLISSLQLSTGSSGGRNRFSPFNSHPNLVGHIFGIAFLCCSVYAIWHRNHKNKIWFLTLASSIISIAIVSAASSRGALIATLCGFSSIFISRMLKGKKVKRTASISTFIIVIVIMVGTITKFDSIQNYFSELFEINSQFRGVDSGMSGRTDNWPFIISYSLETVDGVIIGHGIRSWDDDKFDMATDSSFVNMLWESGVFLTIAVIMLFVKKIHAAAKAENSYISDLILSVLVFALIESIVARYLLAIGNSGSLIILVFILTPVSYFSGRKYIT